MASRMRRFTMTVDGGAVSGARDFTYDDLSEYNRDRADNEAAGDEVRMSEGPFDISFELLAPDSDVDSGYVGTLVVIGKVITRSNAAESSVDKTYTFTQGHFKMGGNLPTENPGRIPVKGQFKTLVIT